MLNNFIKENLEKNNVKNLNQLESVLREICQRIILIGLSQTTFFNYAAFYGETCLRIFHSLNRWSEDLDFQVTSSDGASKINLDDYSVYCKNELESYGLSTSISSKEAYDGGEIIRRYFDISIYDLACEYLKTKSINKEKKISIKLEVSTVYIPKAKYEIKLLASPSFSSVLCFDYSSLFSGKISALLLREWRNRTKGRDYYDYIFYLSHDVKFNMEYLKEKLSYSFKRNMDNIDIVFVRKLLEEKFQETDYKEVINDVKQFLFNEKDIEGLKKEYFIESLNLLECN